MQIVVDLSRLRHNIRLIRSVLPGGFCAVVKAQAYGHGIAVASYIEPLVDCFMVATLDEAEQLLCLGVGKPVLVMGGEIPKCRIDPRIIPTVSTARDAETLIRNGCISFSVAVDTGMNRLGANSEELKAIEDVCRRYGIKPRSTYSHIYGGMSTAGEQSSRFDAMTRGTIFGSCRHLYCSCALDVPENPMYDMTRCGIAMYGYAKGLSTALKARSRIVRIARVGRGEHVGYGDFVLDRDATVATVRCGYADGLRRTRTPLYLTVRGKKCRLLGMPCMDLCMIDVSDTECRVGEFAYMITDKTDVEYLAKAYDTIVYEVLTGLNGRAERIYM